MFRPAVLGAVLGAAALPHPASSGPTEVRGARFPAENVVLHAILDEHSRYSDIWGWTAPDGREYALLAAYDGVAVIDITDRRRPVEVSFVPGPGSSWRDIKTYGSFMYVVNETDGGLQVVDLADPASPQPAPSVGGFSTAHNLYIDEAAARAYIAGRDRTGGILILDLAPPAAPTVAGRWDGAYAHDVYAAGGTAYVSAINDARLFLLDVSAPATPAVLGQVGPYPGAFTHNAWPAGDGVHVLTTDERTAASLRAWDISDPAAPEFAGLWQPPNGRYCIPHNVHVKGHLAYVSWYTAGVRIVDVSDPADMREVAWYDTFPSGDIPAFAGCWGVFPYYPNSPALFVASDIGGGLYVMELLEDGAGIAPVADAPVTTAAAAASPAAAEAPRVVSLGPARPNPVRRGGVVRLTAALPAGAAASARIVDAAGRSVRELVAPASAGGTAELAWDGRDAAGRPVAPGVYFARLEAGGRTAAARMVVTP